MGVGTTPVAAQVETPGRPRARACTALVVGAALVGVGVGCVCCVAVLRTSVPSPAAATSPNTKLGFVHIPKTGGTAIEEWGLAHGLGHDAESLCSRVQSRRYHVHSKTPLNRTIDTRRWGKYDVRSYGDGKRKTGECNAWHEPRPLGVESFCVVRDPFDRLLSEFRHRACERPKHSASRVAAREKTVRENGLWGSSFLGDVFSRRRRRRRRLLRQSSSSPSVVVDEEAQNESDDDDDAPAPPPLRCEAESFNAWVRDVLGGPLTAHDCHLVPQRRYVEFCDHPLKYDALQFEFAELVRDRLGVEANDATLDVVTQPRTTRPDCDRSCSFDFSVLDDDLQTAFLAIYGGDFALWRSLKQPDAAAAAENNANHTEETPLPQSNNNNNNTRLLDADNSEEPSLSSPPEEFSKKQEEAPHKLLVVNQKPSDLRRRLRARGRRRGVM